MCCRFIVPKPIQQAFVAAWRQREADMQGQPGFMGFNVISEGDSYTVSSRWARNVHRHVLSAEGAQAEQLQAFAAAGPNSICRSQGAPFSKQVLHVPVMFQPTCCVSTLQHVAAVGTKQPGHQHSQPGLS